MRAFATVVLVATSVLLGGCGSLLKNGSDDFDSLMQAENIDAEISEAQKTKPEQSAAEKKEAVAKVMVASSKKCLVFTRRLAGANVHSNTSLDILSTIFSATATAVTPLATVHGLTAAGTIASGSKTAIDTDIFAKATIGNMSQAINATYFRDIGAYGEALQTMNPDNIIISVEMAKLLSIHKECALDSAEASIASTLGAAAQPPKQAASSAVLVTITVVAGRTVTAHDSVALIFTATSDSKLSKTITHTVATDGEQPRTMAKDLADQINQDTDLKKASITASQNAQPNDNALTIQAPVTLGLNVSQHVTGSQAEVVTIAPTQPPASNTAQPTNTHGVIPGASTLR
jgi:hypothetical protein